MLGSGAYATVIIDNGVAVKRVPVRSLDSLVREVIFTRCCSHPSIIAIHRAVVRNEYFTIEMKPYPSDLLKYRARGLQDVFAIAYQLLCAVEHMHAAGIIHCDIKAANILIDPGPIPKPVLCDFGISMRVDERVHFGRIQTVDYRAPEVNFDSKTAKYSPAVDIWSIGIVILEMILYKHPVGIIAECEDSTRYAAVLLRTTGETRGDRMKMLKRLRLADISATVARILKCEPDSLLVRSGFCNWVALMLQPNRKIRSAASTLLDIFIKILRREFPEIAVVTKTRIVRELSSLQIVAPACTLDEIGCVTNVPFDIISGFTTASLRYAEYLYQVYVSRKGVARHDVKLACLYIAGTTYCDCKYTRVSKMLDHEQLSTIVTEVIAVIN